MTSSPRRAVIAAHGDVAAGLVSAVGQITGRDGDFATLSNRGLCAADIERDLRAVIAESGARVIFTDLPGGSCTIAARRVARDSPDLVLVTGVNLAALLDFACNDAVPPADAARQAAERGRAAVAASGAPVAG
jgi:PTS system N-acetylgalactosamine-specific IIA component